MRGFVFALGVVVLLRVAEAQVVSSVDLPACAIACIGTLTVGGCKQYDIPCYCKSSAFISSLTCCLQAGCNATEIINVQSKASIFCSSNNVTTTIAFPYCTSTPSGTVSSTTLAVASTTMNTATSPSASTSSASGLGATSSPNATAEAASTSSSLSTGATAGIGVGCALGGVILGALGIFLYRRRRSNRAKDTSNASNASTAFMTHPSSFSSPQSPSNEMQQQWSWSQQQQGQRKPPVEMQAEELRMEADGTSVDYSAKGYPPVNDGNREIGGAPLHQTYYTGDSDVKR